MLNSVIDGKEEARRDGQGPEIGRVSELRYSLELRRVPSDPAAPRDTPSASSTTLRRRVNGEDGRPDPSTSDTSSTSSSPSRPVVSPLAQFSAFPPPALRASADAFTMAVEAAVRCVECEARVRDRAREVKRLRKRIERMEKEAGVVSAG